MPREHLLEESFIKIFSSQRVMSIGGQKKYQNYFEIITILQNNKFFNDTYNTNIDFARCIFPKLESRIRTNRSEFFRFISKQKQIPRKVQGATPSEKTILLVSFLSGIRNRLNHCEILFKPSGGSLNITTKLYNIEIYFDCRKNRILKLLATISEDFL